MGMIESLSHIALVVRDAKRTAKLFEDVFDAQVEQQAEDDGDTMVSVRLGGVCIVLPQADVERPLTGDHIVFAVTAPQMAACKARLEAHGHPFDMARNDTALYLRDYDDHVFELELIAG